MGEQATWDNRTGIYLAAAAMAEFVADIFLCPLEATRIRLVSNPSFASGLASGAARLVKEEGIIKGLLGLRPHPPQTGTLHHGQIRCAGIRRRADRTAMGTKLADLTGTVKLSVAMGSGVIAGVAAAIISHPADTLLSKVNKAGAGGSGSILSRLGNIASEIGFYKLCTVGLGTRCVMIGSLTAGQFLLFDIVMDVTGAEKFHFHDPNEHAEKH